MPRRQRPDPTIGERIRVRRQGRGWSIRHAADRAGISHSTWSRIERGLMGADNRYLIADLAAALECSITDLSSQPLPAADRVLQAAHARLPTLRVSLMNSAFDEPTGHIPRPMSELRREAELLADLHRRCDWSGVVTLLPALLTDLHAASVGSDWRSALRIVLQASFSAASSFQFLGYPGDAWMAAERCREAAERLDDPVSLGYAATARSGVASAITYRRSRTLAVRAVDDLQSHMDLPGALELVGWLHLQSASAALGTKRPGDAADHLREARRLAERTGETTTWNLFFGPTIVRIWAVGFEVDAGDPGKAVELAQDVNPTVVGTLIRRVYFHVDTARALARTRRGPEALRHLLAAERLAPQQARLSVPARETARVLLDRARRQAGGTELRGLCERMGLPV